MTGHPRSRRALGPRLAAIEPVRCALEPGAVQLLEDDEVVARVAIARMIGPQLPDVEIAWTKSLDAAFEALWRSPRLAGFILDWRIGRETCARFLAAARKYYPPPTPIRILTGFWADPAIAHAGMLHHAPLIEKGSWPDLGRFAREVADDRSRVHAVDELLRRLDPKLSPRETQVAHLCAAWVDRKGFGGALGGTLREKYVTRLVDTLIDRLGCASFDELRALLGGVASRAAP